jgi:hypothetical protein
LIQYTKDKGMEMWIVGEDKYNFLNSDPFLQNSHIKYFKPTWNVEGYIQKCKETAGIQLGRTTIEGWLCGKPSWIYKVDSEGNIIDKKLHEVPSDVDKYFAKNVAEKIKKIYTDTL